MARQSTSKNSASKKADDSTDADTTGENTAASTAASTEQGPTGDPGATVETNIDGSTPDPGADAPAATTASDEQLAAAPNSTAARHAAGETVNDSGSTVDPATVDTGERHPMLPEEQAQTGAPAGADGGVTVRSETTEVHSEKDYSDARERQHASLPGEGDHVLFNVTSGPVVVDREGHQVDGKARRRVSALDAVTRAAIAAGDLIDESE